MHGLQDEAGPVGVAMSENFEIACVGSSAGGRQKMPRFQSTDSKFQIRVFQDSRAVA